MKYTLEVEIGASRQFVVDLFTNPENLKKWQENLTEIEFIEGKRDGIGAKTKLRFEEDSHTEEMLEEINLSNLPSEIEYIYTVEGVWNSMFNKFIEINEDHTKWITENEFRFSAEFGEIDDSMVNSFKKETLSSMNKFKNFVMKEL